MIERRKGRIEAPVMIENHSRAAIYVEGRSKFLRDPRNIDIFAMKKSVAIMERVHAALLLRIGYRASGYATPRQADNRNQD